MERKVSNKKKYQAKVVSNKMEGVVKVELSRPTRHPKYKKVVQRSTFFKARTKMSHEVGDVVTIEESRPHSKNVKWVVKENGTEGK